MYLFARVNGTAKGGDGQENDLEARHYKNKLTRELGFTNRSRLPNKTSALAAAGIGMLSLNISSAPGFGICRTLRATSRCASRSASTRRTLRTAGA